MSEINTNFGCIKSPFDTRDLLVDPFLMGVAVPTSYSVREQMSPIKNQGQEGACAGFAGTAIKEWMEIIDYKLTPSTYIDLSERYLYELAKKKSGSSEGTTIKAIYQTLMTEGICREGLWPYVVKDPSTGPKLGADIDAAKFKVDGKIYTKITKESQLKAALVSRGPVLIGVMVFGNWKRDKNGHIPEPTWGEMFKLLGGHAIAIVGYDDAKREYCFKNSWGTSWGDVGYGYLTYKEMKRTLMDGIVLVDIDDPNPWVTVGDLSLLEQFLIRIDKR